MAELSVDSMSIIDVAPTLLGMLDINAPEVKTPLKEVHEALALTVAAFLAGSLSWSNFA